MTPMFYETFSFVTGFGLGGLLVCGIGVLCWMGFQLLGHAINEWWTRDDHSRSRLPY